MHPMHGTLANAAEQTFEIHFARALPLDAREEVIMRLQHQRGIGSAWFDPADPSQLTVQADPAHFSSATLRDFIRGLWVHARLLDE